MINGCLYIDVNASLVHLNSPNKSIVRNSPNKSFVRLKINIYGARSNIQ